MSRALLLVSVGPDETRIALWSVVRGRLIEFRIERAGLESRVGNVYLGRVVRVEKGLGAAFVEIGEARPGFLPLGEFGPGEQGEVPSEGAALIVQVARDARDGKGPRLTARPRLSGRLLLFDPRVSAVSLSERIREKPERERLAQAMARAVPGGEGGFVVRRAATGAGVDALAAEATGLRAVWRRIVEEHRGARPPRLLYRDDPVLQMLRDSGEDEPDAILVDGRRAAEELRRRCAETMPALADRFVFRPRRDWVPSPAEIEEEVETALEPSVPLPSGGSLLFETGRTLTAIDVNSGREVGDPYGAAGGERALLRTNLEAAAEIARQVRLRNLGGILVVDFIDLASRGQRRRVVEALREAVSADPAPCRVGAMSSLGALVEMTRRRRGASLEEQLTAACPVCDGRGRIRRNGSATEGGLKDRSHGED